MSTLMIFGGTGALPFFTFSFVYIFTYSIGADGYVLLSWATGGSCCGCACGSSIIIIMAMILTPYSLLLLLLHTQLSNLRLGLRPSVVSSRDRVHHSDKLLILILFSIFFSLSSFLFWILFYVLIARLQFRVVLKHF